MRNSTLERAIETSANLLSLVEVDIIRTFEFFDLSLSAAAENKSVSGLDSVSSEIRNMVLFDRAATAKHLNGIVITNPFNCTILVVTRSDPPIGNSILGLSRGRAMLAD